MTMKSIKLLGLFLFVLSINSQLIGQDIRSSAQGFSINLDFAYGSWNSESQFLGDLDDVEPSGFGFGAKAAYGINQNIELFIAIRQVGFKQEFDWDAYKVNSVDIGGRYNFGATLRRFRPFLEAALSFHNLVIDPITFDGSSVFKLESSGAGLTIGGGFHIFILPNLSANANGKLTFGNFSSTSLSGTEVDNLEESLDFAMTTIQLGLTYFFQ